MSISKQMKQDLMDMVKTHDWSYMMSDSHSVWEVGMRHEAGIKAKIHALVGIHREDGIGLCDEIKDIAGSDYTDYDNSGFGLKYRVIHSWFRPYIGEQNINQLNNNIWQGIVRNKNYPKEACGIEDISQDVKINGNLEQYHVLKPYHI